MGQLPTDVAAVLTGDRQWAIWWGDCTSALSALPDRGIDVCITDPPYSATVHKNAMTGRWKRELPDTDEQECRKARRIEFGFAHLSPVVRRAVARQCARVIRRWSLFFSDVESCHLWKLSCVACGIEYVRTCEWSRLGGAPQFTGDRPASAFETITCVHPRGRKRWNGGGKAGRYEYPIVANRLGERGSRVHPTQKPLGLMRELVHDFSDEGEVVVDPFCGSGTTGLACLRQGRRFIGIEQDSEHARMASARLEAELHLSDVQHATAGQGSLW